MGNNQSEAENAVNEQNSEESIILQEDLSQNNLRLSPEYSAPNNLRHAPEDSLPNVAACDLDLPDSHKFGAKVMIMNLQANLLLRKDMMGRMNVMRGIEKNLMMKKHISNVMRGIENLMMKKHISGGALILLTCFVDFLCPFLFNFLHYLNI